MVHFTQRSADRIAAVVKTVERRVRNDEPRRARWFKRGRSIILKRFELCETLPQWLSHKGGSGAQVWRWACVRDWDASANDGDGGYITNTNEHIKVADLNETGWFGVAEAKGIAELKVADNGAIYVILDMVCPGGCVCGDVDPDYDTEDCDECP